MIVYVVESLEDHAPGSILGAFATREGAIAFIRERCAHATNRGDDFWDDGENAFEIHALEVHQ